jgi:cysteine desulfuration protein SufE
MDLDEIVETFEALEPGEERYRYLIELGKGLEGLPEELKIEPNRVHGCQSRVWMVVEPEGGRLHVRADSDAFIVRGLVAIVLALFDHRTPAEVGALDPTVTFGRLGLEQMLSMGRRNGLYSMVQRLKALAAATA